MEYAVLQTTLGDPIRVPFFVSNLSQTNEATILIAETQLQKAGKDMRKSNVGLNLENTLYKEERKGWLFSEIFSQNR